MAPSLFIPVFSFVLSLSVAEMPFDGFDLTVPTTDELISEAQFIAKVNITAVSNKRPHYKARVNVICLLKGTAKRTSLNVYGINSPLIAITNGRVVVGSEAIIFATRRTQNPKKWQLIYGGLTGVWAERNITKALGLPVESCQKPQIRSSVGKAILERTTGTSPEATATTSMVTGITRMITPRQSSTSSAQQCARAQNGGTRDPCGEVPWHAFLWDSHVSKTQCDAVVISDSWVLTSARCVQHYTHRPHSLALSLGVSAARSMTKSTRANAVVLHPKWQTPSEKHGEYDMALVKFNKPARNRTGPCHVKPVCLADDDQTPVSRHGLYLCYGSATDVSRNRVKKLHLMPPYHRETMLSHTPVSGKSLGSHGYVGTIDQLRTVWAASVCHAEDGSLRVFQVLSGTTDINQTPALTDVRGQVNNWIRNTVSIDP